MIAILFSMIAYCGWATGDLFAAIGSKKIGAFSMAFWTVVLALILECLYIPFALSDFQHITLVALAVNIALGIIVGIAWITFNTALEVGNPTLIGPIAASFSALVVIFSLAFLKETLNTAQLVAISIIFVGIITTTLDYKIFKHRLPLDKGVGLALFTMLLWGIYFTFIKIPIKQYGWFWAGTISEATNFIIFLIPVLVGMKVRPLTKKIFAPAFVSSLANTVGSLGFNYALAIGLSSIVAPIAGAYPTLFVVLSYFIFKEKITKQQALGIVFTVCGIVLLAFFNK